MKSLYEKGSNYNEKILSQKLFGIIDTCNVHDAGAYKHDDTVILTILDVTDGGFR